MSSDAYSFRFFRVLSAVLVVFILLFLAVVDYLMKRFGSTRYLPLKIGINCRVLIQ